MQDRQDDRSEHRWAGPPDGARRVDPTAAPYDPDLPSSQPSRTEPPPSATIAEPTPVAPAGDATYRSHQDRHRSVRRLANPWYRRLGRGLVAMAFLAAAAVGLYFGAQVVRDVLDRDQLPEEGAEVPTYRSTTIEIRSTPPAPNLDGTITIDTITGSFDFVGRGTGNQEGVQVVSPDGTTLYVRRDGGPWQASPEGDQVATDVVRAVNYLRDDDSIDDVLTPIVRRDHTELVERIEVGEGDDQVVRYQVRLDTAAFEQNSPIEYEDYTEEAIPEVASVRGLAVTITLDAEGALVEVDDDRSWRWQRVTYSDQAFVPINPSLG